MGKIVFVIFILIYALSCFSPERSADQKAEIDTPELPNKEVDKSLEWKLDSIVEYKFSKNDLVQNKTKMVYAYDLLKGKDTIQLKYKWIIKESSGIGENASYWQLETKSLRYSNNGQDTLTILYKDFSQKENVFNTRVEYRYNTSNQAKEYTANIHDGQWSGQNLEIQITDSSSAIKRFHCFEKIGKLGEWADKEIRIDSFNAQSKLVQRFTKRRLPQGEHQRLINFKYRDTLLLEKLIRTKEDGDQNNWRFRLKDAYAYNKNNEIVEESKASWDVEKNEWRDFRLTEWQYSTKNGKLVSKLYTERIESEMVVGNRMDYEYDKQLNRIRETYFEWDISKKELRKYYVLDFVFDENGLVSEKRRSNFNNAGYDQTLRQFTYDKEGRVLMEKHRNKSREDVNWRYVQDKTYRYEMDDEKYTFHKVLYSENRIYKLIDYSFDERNNIVSFDIQTGTTTKNKVEYSYDYTIQAEAILLPTDLEFILNSYNGKWKYQDAPLQREFIRFINGAWKKSSGIKYYYSRI